MSKLYFPGQGALRPFIQGHAYTTMKSAIFPYVNYLLIEGKRKEKGMSIGNVPCQLI